jgi:hypothetical protein
VTTWFNVDFITVKNLEYVMASMFHFISGNTVNMAGVGTLQAIYSNEMFYKDSNSTRKEIADTDESGNKRLTKLYFHDNMYAENVIGVTYTEFTQPIISGFIKTNDRTDLISKSTQSIQPLTLAQIANKTKSEIFNVFKSRLELLLPTSSTPVSQTPSRDMILASIGAAYASTTPLLAWNHIDIMFPFEEREKYGFIQRLYTLTKFVFMLKLLDPTKITDTTHKATSISICQELILHLYKDILQFTTIGDGTSGLQIDDVYADNTKLTHDIRNNSETLIKNKDRVTLTQNNLRSLANLERHVQKTRNLTWYMMIALLVVLVVAGASLMYSYARGMTGEVYLVAIIIVIGVFSFEAFRGAERIFSLPPSTFE